MFTEADAQKSNRKRWQKR